MPGRRRGPLREAVVGVTDHPDAPGAPRLLLDPLQGVPTVGDLVEKRLPLALGAKPASHVLDDRGEPALGDIGGELRHERVATAFVVRDTHEDRRSRERSRVGEVHVGREGDPVAHEDLVMVGSGIERARADDLYVGGRTDEFRCHVSSYSAGRRLDQGRACSNAAAAMSTAGSAAWGAATCRPTGRPSAVQPAGTVMAG